MVKKGDSECGLIIGTKQAFRNCLFTGWKWIWKTEDWKNVNVLEKWMHPSLCGVNADNFLTDFDHHFGLYHSWLNNVHPFMTWTWRVHRTQTGSTLQISRRTVYCRKTGLERFRHTEHMCSCPIIYLHTVSFDHEADFSLIMQSSSSFDCLNLNSH